VGGSPNESTQSVHNEKSSKAKSRDRLLSCFRVDNLSFVEIRDCFIKSY